MLCGVPGAGDQLMVVASEERARRIAFAREERAADARLKAGPVVVVHSRNTHTRARARVFFRFD